MRFFVVVGLGQFGRHTAFSLQEGGGDVLAIDRDDKRVDEVKERVGQAVCMDATDMASLRAVGCAKAAAAILALGEQDLENSILTTAALSDLGVGNIVVRAANELHGRILTRMGATRIVYPEKQMGEHIAKSILMSGVIDQVTLSTGQTVAQILVRRDLVGKTLKEAQLRARYHVNVIGIQRRVSHVDDTGETQTELQLESVPGPDELIGEDDVVILVGTQAQIELVARKD